jgi:hypothetical protein
VENLCPHVAVKNSGKQRHVLSQNVKALSLLKIQIDSSSSKVGQPLKLVRSHQKFWNQKVLSQGVHMTMTGPSKFSLPLYP